MARPNLEVRGANRLRSTLRKAGQDMTQLKDAHKRAAEIVAVAARSRAPRVTGKLAATVRAAGTVRAGIVRAGFKRTPYAGPNNWGWPDGSAPHGSFAGTNFITDAAKATESAWVPVYLQDLDRIIDQVEGI
jgi:hypothetical protein